MTWSRPPPPPVRIGLLGWFVAPVRGFLLVVTTFGGLGLLLLVRLVERPIYGLARPITPHITQSVCKAAFLILGIRRQVSGVPMQGQGALVANHGSWLDIFALNACNRIYFVSKAEVARWPVIGWLARATGTVFINRRGREAKQQQEIFETRLRAGHRLLFFPEGTSSDGLRVLPFKSTLFAAFYSHGLDEVLSLQPVSVIYLAPSGEAPSFYGWWGEMGFVGHFLQVLGARRQGRVLITFHPPVEVDAFATRKDLALHCETEVRRGFDLAATKSV